MPRKEVKPPPKPVLKGVVGIVVPKKAPETPTPVYKYLKDNAEYSEKKSVSTEDTKLFRLQIEQHLNDLRTQTDDRNIKTDLSTANVDNNDDSWKETLENNDTNINTCFNFLKKAVNDVEVVEKKNERKDIREIPKIPKTSLLVPLEMVKEKEGDFFKGTKHQKEQKRKEKKPSKMIRLDDIKDVKAGETYQIDIQPVIVNRWQQKEGSKLFDDKPDPEAEEEEALLQLVLKESIKTAKMEKERWMQESLVHNELNREVEKDKSGRGSKISNVLRDEEENACSMEGRFDDTTLNQLRSVDLPDAGDEWDMPREKVEEKPRREKKQSLRQTLKAMDDYGPCDDFGSKAVQEMAPKKQRLRKSDEKKIENSLKKEESKRNSGELVFVDPEEEEEEKAKAKRKEVKDAPESKENNTLWTESDSLEFSVGKNRKDLSFIDPEARKEVVPEIEMPNDRQQNKYRPKVFWNSGVTSDDHGARGGNQLTNNDRMRHRSDVSGSFPSGHLNIEHNVNKIDKTEPKAQFWNSTAKDDKKGFSSDYQNRRRGKRDEIPETDKTPSNIQNIFDVDSNVPKTRKSLPKKKDFDVFEDIPEMENKNSSDPFQDFEEDVNKTGSEKENLAVTISEKVVTEYLEKVLLQQAWEKEISGIKNQYMINSNLPLQQMANINGNLPLQQMANINSNLPNFSGINNSAQVNNLYLNSLSGMNNQGMMNLSQESGVSPEVRNFLQSLPGLNNQNVSFLNNQNVPGLNNQNVSFLNNQNVPEISPEPAKINLLFDNKPKRVINQPELNLHQMTDQQLADLNLLRLNKSNKIPEDETHILLESMQQLNVNLENPSDSAQLQENLPTIKPDSIKLNPTVPEFNLNKPDDDLSVENLKLRIQKLEQELAKQQQELEARSESRSVPAECESNYSTGSQEQQPEEESGENPPYPENQPYVPFQPQYIPPQSGLFPPQMPVYYSYVPPQFVPPMGGVPSAVPQMPYMNPMMLPVRAPYMPRPL